MCGFSVSGELTAQLPGETPAGDTWAAWRAMSRPPHQGCSTRPSPLQGVVATTEFSPRRGPIPSAWLTFSGGGHHFEKLPQSLFTMKAMGLWQKRKKFEYRIGKVVETLETLRQFLFPGFLRAIVVLVCFPYSARDSRFTAAQAQWFPQRTGATAAVN